MSYIWQSSVTCKKRTGDVIHLAKLSHVQKKKLFCATSMQVTESIGGQKHSWLIPSPSVFCLPSVLNQPALKTYYSP